MKVTVNIPTQIEVKSIRIQLPVAYGDEDMPYDFPLRNGDMWEATVDVDSGRIAGWPQGRAAEFDMKVCDSGTYTLLNEQGKEVAKREQEYVPNDVVPGEYSDYVHLKIDETGRIVNWPKRPDFRAFLPGAED